ncbi:Ger(x)C family spore germination protein [Chengkuizengella sediminis]|uniref:Ger(x)C family spore germination protein n=1 Tax=Chengkuizengella sediminis TaxID=1885917 RepID=UPI00138A1158|nr:Ger(x)C family spore germination protein [Chengkuizengella sediminis]NDI35818.1 Ger(x)C family spore germination protein [Chengkuizengella sediminis]
MNKTKKHHKLKKITLIFFILSQLFFLIGCWDVTDLNDLAIVLGAAIDLEENNMYRTSIQIAVPKFIGEPNASQSSSDTSYIESDTGRLLRETNSKIQSRLSQKLTFAHRRVLLISEELANKKGIREVMDGPTRRPRNQLSATLIVTKGKAYNLLNTKPMFESYSGETLDRLDEVNDIFSLNILEAAQAISSVGSDLVLPYMGAKKIKFSESEEIQILGYAQFRDDKMVGKFEGEAAHGLIWLKNKISPYSVKLKITDDDYVSFSIKNGTTNIEPIIKNEIVHYKVDVLCNASLIEDYSGTDTTKTKNINRLNRNLENNIKVAIQKSIDIIQKNKADSVELGLKLKRKYPREWKEIYSGQWNEELSKLAFSINVQANIVETGHVTENITQKEEY